MSNQQKSGEHTVIMRTKITTLPLTSRGVISTSDLLTARDHLAGLLWPHSIRLIERGARVSFQHNRAYIGQVAINAIHYGPAVKLDVQPGDDSYLLHIPLAGGGQVIRGKEILEVGTGSLIMLNPGQPFKMHLSAGQANLTVRFPGQLLRDFIERETGRAVAGELVFFAGETLHQEDSDSVRRFLAYVCDELGSQRQSLASTVGRQFEQALVSLVLTKLPHSYSELLGGVPQEPAPSYLQRVVDFIATHYAEPLTLQQLAETAAVAPRTLQSGFREYYNQTPMEFLRDYRLDQARQLLTGAGAPGQTVTQIALACGFQHLSKFAKCYRERFGESPSETRKANWRLV